MRLTCYSGIEPAFVVTETARSPSLGGEDPRSCTAAIAFRQSMMSDRVTENIAPQSSFPVLT